MSYLHRVLIIYIVILVIGATVPPLIIVPILIGAYLIVRWTREDSGMFD